MDTLHPAPTIGGPRSRLNTIQPLGWTHCTQVVNSSFSKAILTIFFMANTIRHDCHSHSANTALLMALPSGPLHIYRRCSVCAFVVPVSLNNSFPVAKLLFEIHLLDVMGKPLDLSKYVGPLVAAPDGKMRMDNKHSLCYLHR